MFFFPAQHLKFIEISIWQKEGEYKDFVTFNSKNRNDLLPPNFYGKYQTEGRFYQMVNGDMVAFGCFIVYFELANVWNKWR